MNGGDVGARVLPAMLDSDDVSDPNVRQGKRKRAFAALVSKGGQEFQLANRFVGLDIDRLAQLQ